jgi:hypothetical protein
MTSWSSIHAIILTDPPQRPQTSISILKTRAPKLSPHDARNWLQSPYQTLPPLIHILNNPTPNLPRIRQFRITNAVHSILRRLIIHTQVQIQLIQFPHSLTSRIQLIPSISNQHSHPDKRNRFCRDSSDALGGYSFGSGGEPLIEPPLNSRADICQMRIKVWGLPRGRNSTYTRGS